MEERTGRKRTWLTTGGYSGTASMIASMSSGVKFETPTLLTLPVLRSATTAFQVSTTEVLGSILTESPSLGKRFSVGLPSATKGTGQWTRGAAESVRTKRRRKKRGTH